MRYYGSSIFYYYNVERRHQLLESHTQDSVYNHTTVRMSAQFGTLSNGRPIIAVHQCHLAKHYANMNILRWILAVPSGFAAWFLVLYIWGFSTSVAMSLCPENQIISGRCVADWWNVVVRTIRFVFAGLSAISVVLVTTVFAPKYKARVAALSFVIGAAFAIWLATVAGVYAEMISALLCGGFTLGLLLNYLHSSSNHSPSKSEAISGDT